MSVTAAIRELGALVLLAACAGCSGPSDSRPRDAGARDAADAAANDAGAAQPPACLQALFAGCPPAGACHYDNDGGPPSRFCFANGVRIDETASGGCAGDFQVTSVVRKPDGSPCYTKHVGLDGGSCASLAVTWTDPSGQVIASGHYGLNVTTLQCAGGGETFDSTGPQPPWFSPGTGCLVGAGACP